MLQSLGGCWRPVLVLVLCDPWYRHSRPLSPHWTEAEMDEEGRTYQTACVPTTRRYSSRCPGLLDVTEGTA